MLVVCLRMSPSKKRLGVTSKWVPLGDRWEKDEQFWGRYLQEKIQVGRLNSFFFFWGEDDVNKSGETLIWEMDIFFWPSPLPEKRWFWKQIGPKWHFHCSYPHAPLKQHLKEPDEEFACPWKSILPIYPASLMPFVCCLLEVLYFCYLSNLSYIYPAYYSSSLSIHLFFPCNFFCSFIPFVLFVPVNPFMSRFFPFCLFFFTCLFLLVSSVHKVEWFVLSIWVWRFHLIHIHLYLTNVLYLTSLIVSIWCICAYACYDVLCK